MKWTVRILVALLVLIVLLVSGLFLWGLRPSHGEIAAGIVIDRPAPQVFRWLTGDDKLKKWVGGLTEVELIYAPSDGSEVGKKFRLGESYKNERVGMDMTVTRLEKNHALSVFIASSGDQSSGFTEAADYTLTEQNGKTDLHFMLKTKYFGFMPRLFEPLITPAANKKLGEDFQRLKQLVEQEPVLFKSAADAPTQISRLNFLVGDWAYSEEYGKTAMFERAGRNSGWWKSEITPDGASLKSSFELTGDDPNKGRQVISWDEQQNAFVDHTFVGDSDAPSTVLKGNFEGEALVLRGEFDYEGKHVKFRSETRPAPGGGFRLVEFGSVNGGKQEVVLRGVSKKRGSS